MISEMFARIQRGFPGFFFFFCPRFSTTLCTHVVRGTISRCSRSIVDQILQMERQFSRHFSSDPLYPLISNYCKTKLWYFFIAIFASNSIFPFFFSFKLATIVSSFNLLACGFFVMKKWNLYKDSSHFHDD